MTRGPTTPAMSPRMTSTTRSSSSVKPRSERKVMDRDERKEKGKDRPGDHRAEPDDEDGLEHRDEALERHAHLALVERRDRGEHLLEPPGLLAHLQHLHAERREEPRGG